LNNPGKTLDMTYKIAVAGASGRMGQMLIDAIRVADDCTLSGALDVAGNPAIGQDAGALMGKPTGVAITSDLREGLLGSHVLIDFTRPEGTLQHLKICRELGALLLWYRNHRFHRRTKSGNCQPGTRAWPLSWRRT
jgi:4-hydroxy-tetrahydrodipicolinate reductase